MHGPQETAVNIFYKHFYKVEFIFYTGVKTSHRHQRASCVDGVLCLRRLPLIATRAPSLTVKTPHAVAAPVQTPHSLSTRCLPLKTKTSSSHPLVLLAQFSCLFGLLQFIVIPQCVLVTCDCVYFPPDCKHLTHAGDHRRQM